jgi:hypothetical protein
MWRMGITVVAGAGALRFGWPKLVAASDAAMYVADTLNGSILRARIVYPAEETCEVK